MKVECSMLMYVFSISRLQNVHYFALKTLFGKMDLLPSGEWVGKHVLSCIWQGLWCTIKELSVKVNGYDFVLLVGKQRRREGGFVVKWLARWKHQWMTVSMYILLVLLGRVEIVCVYTCIERCDYIFHILAIQTAAQSLCAWCHWIVSNWIYNSLTILNF